MDNQAAEYVLRLSAETTKELVKALAIRLPSYIARKAKQDIHHIQTTGQQRISQLQKQGTLEHVDISKTDIQAFKHELKRYNVDFSLDKVKGTDQYHAFFKGTDIDRINIVLEKVVGDFQKHPEKSLTLEQRMKAAQTKAQQQNEKLPKKEKSLDLGQER